MQGLDQVLLDSVDQDLAFGRIKADVRSDFILAPHYSAVFSHSSDELWKNLKKQLRSGTYEPELPLVIEVPKKSGLTRPGAILSPYDRLSYQILIDIIAPVAEAQLDRTRVFSQVLLDPDPAMQMFETANTGWLNMQDAIRKLCNSEKLTCAIKADVSCFFERVYQHNIINLLRDSGCEASAVNLLEDLLLAWMERNSHGILQGMFPSDFLGNFALCSLDADLATRDVPSTRYVDDLYIFFPEWGQARKGLADLCQTLRHEGLNLNESKSKILETSRLLREETELDQMFNAAKQELEEGILGLSGYGFQATWEEDHEEELEEADIDLMATEALYNLIHEVEVSNKDKIEKFCFPILGAAGSEIAVDHALAGVIERPYFSHIYCAYLMAIARTNDDVGLALERLASDEMIDYDWQHMWVIATLLRIEKIAGPTVTVVLRILRDTSRSEALRAICALVTGRHGNAAQRRVLRHHYAAEPSPYVRSAILFAARFFPAKERNTAIKAWSGHSPTNQLVGHAARAVSR